jgi:hypothetical protein
MRIRRNSIVTLAIILGLFVVVQMIVAVQAPAGQQGGPAAGGRGGGAGGGAAAPGQGGGRGAGGRGGGGRGGGQPAAPAGPAPRLANGKPDLSGHWANPYTPNMAGRGAVLDPTKKRPDGTCCEPLTWEHQGEALADSKGTPKTFDLPFTEWGRKKWAEYDPVANGDYAGSCLPFGWSRNINSPHGVQVLQNNDAIAFMFEQDTWHTWVPTSASFKWPADLPPTWNGTSVGHWDGDTLVIETKGFNGYTKLDTNGHPHSKDVVFTTTLLRTDSNTIQHTVTIHDPKAYTKDWMNVRTWRIKPTTDVLMEYSCEENNLGLVDGAIVKWKFPENVDE